MKPFMTSHKSLQGEKKWPTPLHMTAAQLAFDTQPSERFILTSPMNCFHSGTPTETVLSKKHQKSISETFLQKLFSQAEFHRQARVALSALLPHKCGPSTKISPQLPWTG